MEASPSELAEAQAEKSSPGTLDPLSDDLKDVYNAKAADSSLVPDAREAARLFADAEASLDLEDDKKGLKEATEALAHFRELHDQMGIADALRLVIRAHCWREKRKEANRMAREELAKFIDLDDKSGQGKMLLSIAEVNSDRRGHKNREIALECANEARGYFKELGEKKMEGYCYLVLINIHLKRKGTEAETRLREGMKSAQAAQELFVQIGDKKGQGIALHGISLAHAFFGSMKSAMQHAKDALGIFQAVDDKLLEAFELQCIAQWHLKEDHPAKALAPAQGALGIFQEFDHVSGRESAALTMVVRVLIAKKEPKRALRMAEEGLDRFQELGDERAEADCLLMKMWAHLQLEQTGEPRASLRSAEAALSAFRELGDQDAESQLLRVVAQLQIRNEMLGRALDTAKEGLAIDEESDDVVRKGLAMHTVMEVHLAREEFDEAMNLANDSRSMFQAAGDTRREAAAWLSLCRVHWAKEDMDRSLEAAKEAMTIFKSVDEDKGVAHSLQVMAEIHMATEDHEGIAREAEHACALHRKTQDIEGEVSCLLLLAQGCILQLTKDNVDAKTSTFKDVIEKGMRFGNEALGVAKRKEDQRLTATVLCTISQVHLSNGKMQEALMATREAEILFRNVKSESGEAQAMVLSANVFLYSGHHQKAIETSHEARAIFERLGDERGQWMAWQVVEKIQAMQAPPPQQQQWQGQQQQGHQAGAPITPLWAQNATQEQMEQYQDQQQMIHFKRTAALNMSQGVDQKMVQGKIQEVVTRLIGEEEVENDTPLMSAGLTSNTAILLRDELSAELPGVSLPPTLVFDYPSIAAISEYIVENTK